MVLATIAMAGRTGATAVEEEEPPPPTAEESLIGKAWVHEDEWSDDYQRGRRRYTLVFTKDRWIGHFIHFLANGSFFDVYTESGGWSVTDTEITGTWIEYVNGEHTTPSFSRSYSWANEERTGLFLQNWNDDSDGGYWLHEDAGEPATDLTGEWYYEEWRNYLQRDGSTSREFETWSLVIAEDTMEYTFTRQPEKDFGTDEMRVLKMTGTLEQDTYGMYLWHTVTAVSASWREGGEFPHLIGRRLRWGYFPAGDELFVSPYWDELRYDSDADVWVDDPANMYGNYGLRLLRK